MNNGTIISWSVSTNVGNFHDSIKASELGLTGNGSVTEVPFPANEIAAINANPNLSADEKSSAISALLTERNAQVLASTEQAGDITTRVRSAVLNRIRQQNPNVSLYIEDLQATRYPEQENAPEMWSVALTSSYGF